MEIKVSDEFVKTFRNLNVINVTEEIKKLDVKEKYLLLLLCLDVFESEDPVVRHNILPFESEVMEIFDLQDDKETTNPVLISLIKETEDKYIDTDAIRTSLGEKLPKPLTKQEVREEKIKIINSIDNQN